MYVFFMLKLLFVKYAVCSSLFLQKFFRTNQAVIGTLFWLLGYGVFATRDIGAHKDLAGIRGLLFPIAEAQHEVCI